MAQAVHRRPHLTLNTDGQAHPRENALAVLTALLATISVIAAFFPSAHVIGSWTGLGGFICAIFAQYVSATTAERAVIVTGWIASAVGLAMGLANGGLW